MEMHNVYVDTSAGTSLVTTAETVLAILPANVSVSAGVLIVLEGAATVTTGLGTTAIVARVRRGNTNAGALVGQPFTVQVGASLNESVPIQVSDTPGEVAGGQYCLTVAQSAATGNGTAIFASLQASWVS